MDPDQYTKILERTQSFLGYLVEHFGAYFIALRSYCLTEFFEMAPSHMLNYFENTAAIMTTIPLKFPSLSGGMDESQWTDLCNSEFVYNKEELMHKVISQGLRQPKVFSDYMGHEQNEWLAEASQRFNVLSVLNFIFREGIKVYSSTLNDESQTD